MINLLIYCNSKLRLCSKQNKKNKHNYVNSSENRTKQKVFKFLASLFKSCQKMSALDPITVNQLSSKPTEAWEILKNTPGPLQPQVMRFKVKPPSKPTTPDKIRFVCISDTHSLTSHLKR